VPIYYEINEHDKEAVKQRAEKIGMHMDWDQYTPLISFFPSVVYTDAPEGSGLDLVACLHRVIRCILRDSQRKTRGLMN